MLSQAEEFVRYMASKPCLVALLGMDVSSCLCDPCKARAVQGRIGMLATGPRLTTLQKRVWELDRSGKTPSEIASELGRAAGQIANVKARLRSLGYPVQVFHDRYGSGAKATRTVIDRCKCGLALPCNSCVSDLALSLAQSRPGEGHTLPSRPVSGPAQGPGSTILAKGLSKFDRSRKDSAS